MLRLIRRTTEVGEAAGLDVCVCGEMASQPLTAYALVGLGVRQLSVAARSVPVVKRLIRGISVRDAQLAATAAMEASTAAEAEAELRQRLRHTLGAVSFL